MKRIFALSFGLFLIAPLALSAEIVMEMPSGPPMDNEQAKPPPVSQGQMKGEELFYGQVNFAPSGGYSGKWRIAGRPVAVTGETFIDDKGRPFKVGSRVEVIGHYEDGVFQARELKRRR